MMPEEFEASCSAKSFAWCAGFFRRRYEGNVLISPEEVDPAAQKSLGATTTDRRIKQDMRRI
jgi:hypothetical protein